MKVFNSFDAFSDQIGKLSAKYKEKEFAALNFVGSVLEEEAKHKIGHLQHGAGPFENWKELAESTKLDKARKGYVFNADYNPLYRTGDLKDSIHHVVNPATSDLYVGSSDEIAIFQEFGTKNIPARSFLGLTLFKEKAEIQFILGLFMLYWIIDSSKKLMRSIHGSV